MPAALSETSLPHDLLAWSDETRRDLPWRRTRDPWAVLVSELMLQQTQVARVVPKYAAFLDRFPTVPVCAAAPAGEVVRLWAGLGYNRRALNLHAAARACVERHGGQLPDTLVELQALPDDQRAAVLDEVADLVRRGPIAEQGESFVERYRTELFWCRRR